MARGVSKEAAKWLLIFFMPEGCTVRDRMVYAASAAALKDGLGQGNFEAATYSMSHPREACAADYAAVSRSMSQDELLTLDEKAALDGEMQSALAMSSTRQRAIVGLPIKASDEALEALANVQRGEPNTVILSLNADTEVLQVQQAGNFTFEQIQSKLPVSEHGLRIGWRSAGIRAAGDWAEWEMQRPHAQEPRPIRCASLTTVAHPAPLLPLLLLLPRRFRSPVTFCRTLRTSMTASSRTRLVRSRVCCQWSSGVRCGGGGRAACAIEAAFAHFDAAVHACSFLCGSSVRLLLHRRRQGSLWPTHTHAERALISNLWVSPHLVAQPLSVCASHLSPVTCTLCSPLPAQA